jgi:hypothetical protein
MYKSYPCHADPARYPTFDFPRFLNQNAFVFSPDPFMERICEHQEADCVVSRHTSFFEDDPDCVNSGDSFSHVGYSSRSPVPTSSSPLGVAFPGQTVTEPGLPNWLGYLVRDYGHGHANIIAYNYARRGDTVLGVSGEQVSREFLPSVGRNPGWATWGQSDTIFGMIRDAYICLISNGEV